MNEDESISRIDQLFNLWDSWNSSDKTERFGQYVCNRCDWACCDNSHSIFYNSNTAESMKMLMGMI